jgi:hypothetical protein
MTKQGCVSSLTLIRYCTSYIYIIDTAYETKSRFNDRLFTELTMLQLKECTIYAIVYQQWPRILPLAVEVFTKKNLTFLK